MSTIWKYLRRQRHQNRVSITGQGPVMEEKLTFPYRLEDTLELFRQQFGPSPNSKIHMPKYFICRTSAQWKRNPEAV